MSAAKRRLKVGFHLPNPEGWMGGRTARWTDIVAMAKRAEEVGFDSLWVADHMLYEFPPGESAHGLWEAWTLLTAVAASTERIELGPLVACTGFRNPALLAKMADTLDEVSGGRLILGLAAGYHELEHRTFGYPFDHLVGRFEEALQIIHNLLRTGTADFEGQWYQLKGCELRPRGPRPEGPPIMIGALGNRPRMLRLVAQYGDLWNGFADSLDDLAPARAGIDAACARIGRDPATLARSVCVVTDLPGSQAGADWVARLRRDRVRGSVEELADLLRAFDQEGISHVIIFPQPNTLAGIDEFAAVLERLNSGETNG